MMQSLFFYIIFFIFSFGQLQRLSFLNQLVNVYVFELVMVGYIGWYMLALARGKNVRSRIRKAISGVQQDPLVMSLTISIGIIVLSMIWRFWDYTETQNVVGFLYAARLFIYILFAFSIQRSKHEMLRKGIVLFAVCTLFFTAVQYVLYPNLQNLYYLGWDNHIYRAFGLWFDTTTAAVIYGITGILLIHDFKRYTLGPRFGGLALRRLLVGGLIILYSLLIIFTYSRSVYLGLAIVGWYVLQKRIGFVKLAIITLCLAALLFLLPRPASEGARLERTSTIVSRVKDMQEGITLWSKHPILGVGYNRIRFHRQTLPETPSMEALRGLSHSGSNFSSVYVTVLASTGIVGLVSFAAVLWFLWKRGNEKQRALLLFILVVSAFDNVLLVNVVLFLSIVGWKVTSD